MVCLLMTHTLEGMEFLDLGLLLATVTMADSYVHTILQSTTVYTTYGDTTGVRAIIKRCDQELRSTLQLLRSRDNLHNLVEQIVNVICWLVVVIAHPAILCRTVNYSEVKLFLSSIEVAHQVEHHFVHLFRATVRLIYLINYNDRLQSELQSLLQHETSLRHRTLESIDEEEASVCHVEHALHLTTEVRVSWSIENINLCTFPIDRHIL